MSQIIRNFAKRFFGCSNNYVMDNKALKIIHLLSDGNDWSIDNLAQELSTTRRTIYRTLEELEHLGYVVNRNHGHPKIVKFNPDHDDLNRMINFTIEEQALLRHLLQAEEDDNPLRISLLNKLQKVLGNSEALPPMTSSGSAAKKVRLISQAMQQHQQAMLLQYASGSSKTLQDRRVEPVAWSANYRELHAFDLDRMAMRCFLVSRMKGVQVLDQPWQHEARHVVPEIDCFWMSGRVLEEVTLDMSRLALNLLHEEFPLSRKAQVRNSKDSDRPYRVTLPICQPQGAGRFVMGMGRQCRVLKGTALMNYIQQEKA